MASHVILYRLTELEIARGHDGLLRGAPDPAIISAAYLRVGEETHLIDRMLHRVKTEGPFPARFDLEQDEHRRIAKEVSSENALEVLIVTIALEEDGGEDVQRLYGAMERPEELTFWSKRDAEIEPVALPGIRPLEWLVPRPVNLIVDSSDAAKSCRNDKWIGCALHGAAPSDPPLVSQRRINLLSPDKRNDWTLFVELRC